MKIKNIVNPLLQLKFLLKKPHTVRYPYDKKEPSKRYRGSHYNDINTCIGCGNCSTICMNEAIDMVKVDGIEKKEQDSGLRPRVDYGRCCWCGLCVDICPSGSLKFSNVFSQIEESPDKFMYIPGLERQHLKDSISYTQDTAVKLQNPERVKMKHMEPETRIKSFAEEIFGYTQEEARKEAQRCLECGVCVIGCPDSMHIPEYISAIEKGDDKGAVKLMLDNNPVAEICGKVCTRHCEDLCVASYDGEPVAIRWLKRYASEQLFDFIDDLNIKPQPDNGKKIGIIGGGPSGITVAYYLRLKGYDVTIYEKYSKLGGMAYVGIPKYRLPLDSLERQEELLRHIGVNIKFNTVIGKDISFDNIYKQYDAVFMGIGFHKPIPLNLEGEDTEGIIQAADFLREVNLGNKVKIGKNVIVIGGGNVAIDAARVSRRLGANVKIYYRRRMEDMPADGEEIRDAIAEGIEIITQNIPLQFKVGKNNKLHYMCGPAKMVEEEGKRRPKPVLIEGEEFCVEDLDTIIIAIGQKADYSFLDEKLREKIVNKWGSIEVDENGMTKYEKLFAGGDTVNSKRDIISAVADGTRAVRGIHKYLNK